MTCNTCCYYDPDKRVCKKRKEGTEPDDYCTKWKYWEENDEIS